MGERWGGERHGLDGLHKTFPSPSYPKSTVSSSALVGFLFCSAITPPEHKTTGPAHTEQLCFGGLPCNREGCLALGKALPLILKALGYWRRRVIWWERLAGDYSFFSFCFTTPFALPPSLSRSIGLGYKPLHSILAHTILPPPPPCTCLMCFENHV